MAYRGQKQNASTSAFGELLVSRLNGETQLQFPYNLNPDLVSVTTTSSGTVISSPPYAVLSTGLSATGSALLSSDDRSHYRTGEGVSALFTALFTSGTAGSQQYVGLGDKQNGFFFGFNGADFGILYRQATYGTSVAQVIVLDNWIFQSSWNQDPFNGTGVSGVTLDPTKGNVYKIQMQWLGFGDINFFIENPITGQLAFVHKILYPNLNTNTSVSNASMPLLATAINSTNTKNMVVKVPSMAMFIEGKIFQNDVIFSLAEQGSSTAVIRNLVSITNVSTFNGILNNKVVVLSSISMSGSNTGSRSVIFHLFFNVTNVFAFTDLSPGNSCVQYNTASTAIITGGRKLFVFYLDTNGEDNIDMTQYNVYLNPGDVLTVGKQQGPTGAGSQTMQVNLNWIERY